MLACMEKRAQLLMYLAELASVEERPLSFRDLLLNYPRWDSKCYIGDSQRRSSRGAPHPNHQSGKPIILSTACLRDIMCICVRSRAYDRQEACLFNFDHYFFNFSSLVWKNRQGLRQFLCCSIHLWAGIRGIRGHCIVICRRFVFCTLDASEKSGDEADGDRFINVASVSPFSTSCLLARSIFLL